MSNLTARLQQLEKQSGAHDVYKYMCVISPEWLHWDTPEESAKGYKIQPFTTSQGGTGGAPFYLATREDLQAFAARPDVDLAVIEIGTHETLDLGEGVRISIPDNGRDDITSEKPHLHKQKEVKNE